MEINREVLQFTSHVKKKFMFLLRNGAEGGDRRGAGTRFKEGTNAARLARNLLLWVDEMQTDATTGLTECR